MNTQHQTSFSKAVLGSAQRLFRFNKNNNLLANSFIDARTMRDIGIKPFDQF